MTAFAVLVIGTSVASVALSFGACWWAARTVQVSRLIAATAAAAARTARAERDVMASRLYGRLAEPRERIAGPGGRCAACGADSHLGPLVASFSASAAGELFCVNTGACRGRRGITR